MALEKAVITNTDTGDEISVMFNPGQYSISKTTPWTEIDVFGMDSQPVQFTQGNRRKLSMELFFDTTQTGNDVRDETKKIEVLSMVNAQEHRPPLLNVAWGSLTFDCVLENLSMQFIYFSSTGKPLRAKMQLSFLEYATSASQLSATRRESADHTKRFVLREGDSLSSICGREYNDCRKWRVIADANDIDDPESVCAGSFVELPPLY